LFYPDQAMAIAETAILQPLDEIFEKKEVLQL
jgi:hypothetical protein